MSRILLHICCAPCLCHPHRVLTSEGADITGFWYNPNIHPYKEYQNRLNSVKDFSRHNDFKIDYRDEYPLEENLDGLLKDRCNSCYLVRLDATARQAVQGGYDYFSTTLLYSIYQKHELIKDIGIEAGKRLGVNFLYRDFRAGWEEGLAMAGEMDLYRQKYCGCIFSERDRYLKTKKNQN
jgi:predicted adenine nucleotide alpha hydrolase (AANH) superfamily ATPase